MQWIGILIFCILSCVFVMDGLHDEICNSNYRNPAEDDRGRGEFCRMIVRRRYYSGEPILDASDHVATEIMPVAVIERFGSLDSAQEILLL